jgi:D-3-phosphoglycerate dehydrogenase / 2-oxoglutarate reductase
MTKNIQSPARESSLEKKTWSLLITESFDFEIYHQLKSDFQFQVFQGSLQSQTQESLKNIEILVIRSKTKINEETLQLLPKLKLIVSCTAGFDHINLQDLALPLKQGLLTLCHTPSAHTQSTAELTWALLLGCYRKIPLAHSFIKEGNWNRQELLGRELAGKTLGIVGLGRIGRQVAKMAQAFSMKTLAFDPYQDDFVFQQAQTKRLSYHELVLSSDIISFHVPQSQETYRMLRLSNLEDIAHGVTIINTSRGHVLDPHFITEGLKKGFIQGLGLDVHLKEPLDPGTEYLHHPRVLCTPHVGAQTHCALKKVSEEAYKKILSFIKGTPISDTLPPEDLWYRSPMGFVDG